MKTFTIKSNKESEIKSAISKQWNLNDRIRVEDSTVTPQQLVSIAQSMNLDGRFVVCVVCYGQPELWRSKRKAVNFYENGWRASDGSEAQRYENILYKLGRGYKIATDQM